eukprot:6468696-Amphidinium_carterae.1
MGHHRWEEAEVVYKRLKKLKVQPGSDEIRLLRNFGEWRRVNMHNLRCQSDSDLRGTKLLVKISHCDYAVALPDSTAFVKLPRVPGDRPEIRILTDQEVMMMCAKLWGRLMVLLEADIAASLGLGGYMGVKTAAALFQWMDEGWTDYGQKNLKRTKPLEEICLKRHNLRTDILSARITSYQT